MTEYLTGGQASILAALLSGGGKRKYLEIAHRNDFPEIRLSDFAKLERDGLIRYLANSGTTGGAYELTPDGDIEARRRAKAA